MTQSTLDRPTTPLHMEDVGVTPSGVIVMRRTGLAHVDAITVTLPDATYVLLSERFIDDHTVAECLTAADVAAANTTGTDGECVVACDLRVTTITHPAVA